jgi:hypothetical protein
VALDAPTAAEQGDALLHPRQSDPLARPTPPQVTHLEPLAEITDLELNVRTLPP